MKNRGGASNNSGLAFAFTAPAFLVMGAMVLYPFVFNVVISFSNMSLTHFGDWSLVGLQELHPGPRGQDVRIHACSKPCCGPSSTCSFTW